MQHNFKMQATKKIYYHHEYYYHYYNHCYYYTMVIINFDADYNNKKLNKKHGIQKFIRQYFSLFVFF